MALIAMLRPACYFPAGKDGADSNAAQDDGAHSDMAYDDGSASHAGRMIVIASGDRLACCNDCHRRGSDQAEAQPLTKRVAQSCSVCHRM